MTPTLPNAEHTPDRLADGSRLPSHAMEGYEASTYGDSFADVYDDWYTAVSDIDATIATLADLAVRSAESRGAAARAEVLELGVGTGRVAIPLATTHRDRLRVIGVDTSSKMLEVLHGRDRDGLVDARLDDMVAGLPDGPFDLAFIAYNTLFNLTDDGEQQRCFDAVAARLHPGGCFVVEAFVPDDPPRAGDVVAIRSMTTDRIVLSLSRHDAGRQRAEGHFVELSEAGGVRLRPWSIRYATPTQIDAAAERAGLVLRHRWGDMTQSPFDPHGERHVSVYHRP